MICSRCGSQNSPQANFCEQCGTQVSRTCSACGAPRSPSARFCAACGQPAESQIAPPGELPLRAPNAYTPRHLAEKILTSRSALEGERKQVTVLFVDVAGFTALAERLDPEAIHEVMDGCFANLTEHDGRAPHTLIRMELTWP